MRVTGNRLSRSVSGTYRGPEGVKDALLKRPGSTVLLVGFLTLAVVVCVLGGLILLANQKDWVVGLHAFAGDNPLLIVGSIVGAMSLLVFEIAKARAEDAHRSLEDRLAAEQRFDKLVEGISDPDASSSAWRGIVKCVREESELLDQAVAVAQSVLMGTSTSVSVEKAKVERNRESSDVARPSRFTTAAPVDSAGVASTRSPQEADSEPRSEPGRSDAGIQGPLAFDARKHDGETNDEPKEANQDDWRSMWMRTDAWRAQFDLLSQAANENDPITHKVGIDGRTYAALGVPLSKLSLCEGSTLDLTELRFEEGSGHHFIITVIEGSRTVRKARPWRGRRNQERETPRASVLLPKQADSHWAVTAQGSTNVIWSDCQIAKSGCGALSLGKGDHKLVMDNVEIVGTLIIEIRGQSEVLFKDVQVVGQLILLSASTSSASKALTDSVSIDGDITLLGSGSLSFDRNSLADSARKQIRGLLGRELDGDWEASPRGFAASAATMELQLASHQTETAETSTELTQLRIDGGSSLHIGWDSPAPLKVVGGEFGGRSHVTLATSAQETVIESISFRADEDSTAFPELRVLFGEPRGVLATGSPPFLAVEGEFCQANVDLAFPETTAAAGGLKFTPGSTRGVTITARGKGILNIGKGDATDRRAGEYVEVKSQGTVQWDSDLPWIDAPQSRRVPRAESAEV